MERDTWHHVVFDAGTEAYHQILPQMGYLDPDEVSDILECYRGYWDICREYRYEAEEASAQGHFRIAADRHERLLDRCAKLVNEAHPVIVALQRQEAGEGRGNGSKRLRSKLGRMLPVPG